MNIRCARFLILAAGAGALALPAAGQQLEEIVVTATKREESLQEVPLAITTVDGVLLDGLLHQQLLRHEHPGGQHCPGRHE